MSFVDKSNFDLVWCTMLDLFLGQGGARSFHDAHTDFRGNGLGTGHEVRHVVPWFSVRDRDGHAPVGTYRGFAEHPKVARRFCGGLDESMDDGCFAGMGCE